MYMVEWLDDDGNIRTVKGFKTSEEVFKWIKMRDFDPVFECPQWYFMMENNSTNLK